MRIQLQIGLMTFMLAAAAGYREAAAGITITPAQPGASGLYKAAATYDFGTGTGWTVLNPASLTLTPAVGGGNVFNLIFDNEFGTNGTVNPGWTLQAGNRLNGTLEVKIYEAVGTAAVVGGRLSLTYTRAATDPADLFWIQRVSDNHGLRSSHGTGEATIDSTDGLTPFYGSFTSNNPNFYDYSKRTDSGENHAWSAELLLVSRPDPDNSPKLIVGYDSFYWGWSNTWMDQDDDFRSPGGEDSLLASNFNTNAAVPEPSTIVMVGIAGIVALVLKVRRSGTA